MISRKRYNSNERRFFTELKKQGYTSPRLKKVEREALEQGLSPTKIARARKSAIQYNKTRTKGQRLVSSSDFIFGYVKKNKPKKTQKIYSARGQLFSDVKRERKNAAQRRYYQQNKERLCAAAKERYAKRKAEKWGTTPERVEVTLPLIDWYKLPRTVRTGKWNESTPSHMAFNYMYQEAGIWDGTPNSLDPNVIVNIGEADGWGNKVSTWLKIVFPEYDYEVTTTDGVEDIKIYERVTNG